MFNLPGKPQSVTDIIATSFQFYTSVFQRVLYLMIAIALIAAIGNYLTTPSQASSAVASGFSVVNLLISLLVFLITMVLYAAALVLADKHVKGEMFSINDAIQVAITKVVPILIASIIVYIAVVIGSILLIIPGIFVAILTSMYLPAIVLENRDAINAIKLSCELVWGNWWRTFAVFLLAGIIPLLLYFFTGLITAFSHGIVAFVINIIVYGIVSPFLLAVLLVLFRDLQLRAILTPDVSQEQDHE